MAAALNTNTTLDSSIPPTMLADDRGYSKQFLQNQTMHVDHPEQALGFSNIHMSVDQYPESYERTKLGEQGEPMKFFKQESFKLIALSGSGSGSLGIPNSDIGQADIQMREDGPEFEEAKVEAVTSHATQEQQLATEQDGDDTVSDEDSMKDSASPSPPIRPRPRRRPAPARTRGRRVVKRNQVPYGPPYSDGHVPLRINLPQYRANLLRQRERHVNELKTIKIKAQLQDAVIITDDGVDDDVVVVKEVPRPLPSVIRIKPASAELRVKYNMTIVIINGQKYVQIDAANLVPARNVEALHTGPDTTIRFPQVSHWNSERRGNRPPILFLMLPKGCWEYTVENDRPKRASTEFIPEMMDGYIVLNGSDQPMKWSPIMPQRCSTEIEGWEMEAMCRYDPTLCHQDFIDRMLPPFNTGKALPSKGTLNHRRRRDRLRMRIIPWPTPAKLSYSDRLVIAQAGAYGQTNNSTFYLEDLTQEEMTLHNAITYGSHFERSGRHAQDGEARTNKFRENLTMVRRKFGDASEEVGIVLGNIAMNMDKMGKEFKPELWDDCR